jgi:branched-chain amino acid transport system ATP-binding protein
MLELRNIGKSFGGLRAVHDVSLTVPEGQIVGLIGPNGSGKSTLINVISGILKPTAGRVLFAGRDITNLTPESIFQLGMARGFQDPSLFFQMTVLDNVLLPVKNQRGEHPWYAPWRRLWNGQEKQSARKAAEILERVKLREHFDKRASDLSGGQMKLLDIARCLMGDPRMMLLDEPTAGVAPTLAYDIFEQIAALRTQYGITFLIVEHRLDILFDFADSVYVMHMGDVLAQGTPDEIIHNDEVQQVYLGE